MSTAPAPRPIPPRVRERVGQCAVEAFGRVFSLGRGCTSVWLSEEPRDLEAYAQAIQRCRWQGDERPVGWMVRAATWGLVFDEPEGRYVLACQVTRAQAEAIDRRVGAWMREREQ